MGGFPVVGKRKRMFATFSSIFLEKFQSYSFWHIISEMLELKNQ